MPTPRMVTATPFKSLTTGLLAISLYLFSYRRSFAFREKAEGNRLFPDAFVAMGERLGLGRSTGGWLSRKIETMLVKPASKAGLLHEIADFLLF